MYRKEGGAQRATEEELSKQRREEPSEQQPDRRPRIFTVVSTSAWSSRAGRELSTGLP
jgi:hypothetical protein